MRDVREREVALSRVDACAILDLPRIEDARGSLTFVEAWKHVPFAIRRVYWIYDVPGGATRGGHAYTTLHEVMIALSGSFDVVVDADGENKTFTLNRSYCGLHVPNMIWRQLRNFSTNAVCLILASAPFDDADYVRSYEDFLRLRGRSTL